MKSALLATTTEQARKRPLSVTAATTLFIVVVCLSLFALSGWQIWKARQAQLREATTTGADLARSLAQHADSGVKAVDTALVGLIWRSETEGRGQAFRERLHEHLVRQVRELPQLLGMFVFDENGQLVVDSMEMEGPRPNVRDRDYFQYHRDHPDRGPHVGGLMQSKTTGKWVLPVSRRMNRPDGSFGGVVVASIDLEYFQRFYDAYEISGNGVILLVHADTTVLVRRPFLQGARGTSLRNSKLFSSELLKSGSGHFTSFSIFDQIEKFSSYRRLEQYPLIVVVSRPMQDILGEWRAGAMLAVAVVTLLAMGLALLGGLLLQTLRRNLRTESSLLASEKRIRIISDNLPLAIAYVGTDEKLQFANQAFAASVRRSVEHALGQSFASLLGSRYPENAQYVTSALRGEQVRFERTVAVEGKLRHLESRYIPDVDEDGAVQGFYSVTVDISARKQLELEQQNAHRELQTIIDYMPSLVGYWGLDMRNRFGNQPYLAWYGIAPDEMRGMHIREVIGEELFAANRGFIEAALAGKAQLFEKSIADANGTLRSVVASYVPDMRHEQVVGFYEFITDITSLKQARNAQFEARAQLQGVIDAAKEFSIVATDLNGVIRIFSTGAERMLGYRAHEMVGRRTMSVLHVAGELAERGTLLRSDPGSGEIDFAMLVEATRNGRTQAGEWTYVRKDGSQLPVYLVVTAIHDAQGEVSGLLGVARDITEQRQLHASLNAAKEQAEFASRAKSEFVANMSHEIRTPMNAVLGVTQMLGNTPLLPDQKKYLDMIQTAGRSLLDILNDILDFSKVEAGRMELALAPFKLSDVLDAVATMMVVNASKKDLEIVVGVEPDVPDLLVGDAQRLQQVLLNLAGNAVKFTSHGEVAVLVSCAQAPAAGSVRLRVAVRDTGIGISKSQLQRLFTPFSQAEESTARRFGGTGLGLAISRRMVDLMQGQLSVTSEPGKGSQFHIEVTLKLGAGPATPLLSHPPALQARRSAVLLLDDNETSRHYLALTMRTWGWEVDSAGSGKAALTLLRHGGQYDVLLADWPVSDGDSAMAELRAACAERGMRYVAMATPHARERLAQSDEAAAADAILLKPATASSLFDTLNQVLQSDAQRLAAVPQASAPAVGAVEAPRADGPLAGVKLLLVEDNAFNQVVARGLLEQAGAVVDVVDNGKLALDYLALHAETCRMVLMDVQMPVMDGFMATRAIRDQLKLNLPILAMSAGVMLDERDACAQAGMNDFIPKPIEQSQMIALIRRHLGLDGPLPETPPASTASAPPVEAPGEELQRNFDRMLQFRAQDSAYQRGIVDFIRAMAARGPQSLATARTAWLEGRHDEAARQFHTMRGSIGTLGAKRFVQTALALEQAIRAGDSATVEELMTRAGAELDEVVQAARMWLEAREAPDLKARADAPVPLDVDLLARLRDYLAQQNMAAIDLYASVRPALRSYFSETELATLDQAVGQLAFAQALEQLRRVP